MPEDELETVRYRKVEPKKSLFSRILSPIEKITRPSDDYKRKKDLARLEAQWPARSDTAFVAKQAFTDVTGTDALAKFLIA